MTEFSVAVPFINTKINPGQNNYRSTYLEDRNYATFTTNFGASVYVSVEEDVVETDVSLTPMEEIVTENVVTVPDLFNTVYYMKSGPKPYIEVTSPLVR